MRMMTSVGPDENGSTLKEPLARRGCADTRGLSVSLRKTFGVLAVNHHDGCWWREYVSILVPVMD